MECSRRLTPPPVALPPVAVALALAAARTSACVRRNWPVLESNCLNRLGLARGPGSATGVAVPLSAPLSPLSPLPAAASFPSPIARASAGEFSPRARARACCLSADTPSAGGVGEVVVEVEVVGLSVLVLVGTVAVGPPAPLLQLPCLAFPLAAPPGCACACGWVPEEVEELRVEPGVVAAAVTECVLGCSMVCGSLGGVYICVVTVHGVPVLYLFRGNRTGKAKPGTEHSAWPQPQPGARRGHGAAHAAEFSPRSVKESARGKGRDAPVTRHDITPHGTAECAFRARSARRGAQNARGGNVGCGLYNTAVRAIVLQLSADFGVARVRVRVPWPQSRGRVAA